MPPGAFLVFFWWSLAPDPGFRSAKEILVVSFATQPRAFILSDRNIFYTPGGENNVRGLMPPGAFLGFFCHGQLPQTSARSKQYLTVNFVRLAFIRQNFHESWCRKLPAIYWHENPSMKARTKVLARLSLKAGMNSRSL